MKNATWLFSLIYPSLTWKIKTGDKKIYLTFDDGPVPGITDYVIEELAKNNIKGTFFCVGDNIKKHPETFSRLIKEGHSIGNHTYNHLNGWKNDNTTFLENVEKCQLLIKEHGYLPNGGKPLFRPPYGKITRRQILALRDHYDIIMWDVLTRDYDQNLYPEKCLQNSIEITKAGSIVIFHDNFKAQKNLHYALPAYIEYFLKAGYEFHKL